jgi:hypothetical protein
MGSFPAVTGISGLLVALDYVVVLSLGPCIIIELGICVPDEHNASIIKVEFEGSIFFRNNAHGVVSSQTPVSKRRLNF